MICEVTIFVKHETDEEQAMKCLKARKIGGKKAPSHEGGGDQMSTSVCVKADRHSRLNLNFSFFFSF